MSFDRLAPHYRWMEHILAGEKLQRCRTAFIDRIKNHQNILILGPGAGRFVTELADMNRSARITCVDSSSAMLKCTKERLIREKKFGARFELLHQDLLTWTPPCRQFDAIISHFFLDCFTPNQVEGIVRRAAGSANPGALWLIADFCEPTHGLARWRARAILWVMYRFFRFSTGLPAGGLTNPDFLLKQNGFELRDRLFADWNLLRSDLWQQSSASSQCQPPAA